MKKCKKVIAVLAALLIVTRVVLMGVSAAMVGAGTMLGIIAVLAAALVYSGTYSQAQVDNMSNNEIIWSVKNGLNNGSIDPKKDFPNPDGTVIGGLSTASLVDWLTNSEFYENWKDGTEIIENAMDDWLTDWYRAWNNDYTQIEDVVKPVLSGDVDMKGFGALLIRSIHDAYSDKLVEDTYYYCDYIDLTIDYNTFSLKLNNCYSKYITPSKDSDLIYEGDRLLGAYSCNQLGNYIQYGYNKTAYFLYGDVRNPDGTAAPTEDVYEYPLGETADGTKVTADMLNPDGTVTVDGVTEKPSDYINIDYYTDPAVIDLLQQILNALDNANVVAPDITNEFIQNIIGDTELEISSELSDYTIPQMIATVFPFCIPVDFVRGMKLLLEEPETPVFKAELDLTNICGFDLGKQEIEISFEKWEPAAKICRWFFTFMFGYVLIFLTFKIVKGV